MAIDISKGGVMLGDRWKLYPIDERNWELCELRQTRPTHTAAKAGTVGTVQWQRCGKFYSYNTVPNAIAYVADVLAKERALGEALTLAETVGELREMYDEMAARVAEAMGVDA